MDQFFKDRLGDAGAESAQMAGSYERLHAKLLALSGLQRQGVRGLRLYHADLAKKQSLYFDSYSIGGHAGYIFFRQCSAAPSPWLIVMIREGTPDRAAFVEALRRFDKSDRS